MNFGKNVLIEVRHKNMTKSSFAKESGITLDAIMKGCVRNSIPRVDTALKIAKVLDVSIEYLMQDELIFNGDKNISIGITDDVIPMNSSSEIRLFRKYSKIIENFEKLNEKQLKIISNIAIELSEV